MTDDSSQLDPLYLATHFHKLRTQTVAHIRKSKHYATTLAAWQKKLKGVDVSDLAAVAKTLGFNVEVFNPLASSEPQTLFSGGGRSKRKAQLLKVKRALYKPMKAGAIIDDPRFPPDIMRDVVGRLDQADRSSLLGVSRAVREDTMAALPPQEKLWAAARSLNMEHVKQALEEGARVNKIDPSVGMNALKMIEGRNGSSALYSFLERQGGKPLNLEQINRHLVRCVKVVAGKFNDTDSDSESDSDAVDKYYPYEIDDYDPVDPEMIKEALLDGADPNTRTEYNQTYGGPIEGSLLHVLTVRAIEGISDDDITADVIKDLKSFGIDMNQVDVTLESTLNPKLPSGSTALHYACWVADSDRELPAIAGIRPSIVKALLEAGIDVNKQDSRGRTALHWLVQYGGHDEDSLEQEDISLARLLLSHGADVSIKDEDGKRVIDYTEEEDDVFYDPVMLDVLLRATETREDFIQAVKDGNVESVRQFLQQGVPVNTKDDRGETPLHNSASNGHLEVARFLIEAGADVNAKAKYGWTPLHWSAGRGHLEVARALIEAGADVNAKEDDGMTSLHFSARFGHVKVARALIEAGADVSAKDVGDFTPLHWSAGNGHLEISKFLIEAGADVNARDSEGRTPLDINPRLAEFQQNGVRPRQEDNDQGQGRNVRQRVGGGGNTSVGVDLNADSRGAGYGEDDAAHTEIKTYKNKNLGQFTSIPLKLSAGDVSDANLDSLYLATHFHKLRTQTVAHIRKSKHYATTLAAWQKKLKDVDVSDLAAVAGTLGLNVEVFDPLASSSKPQTLFSGGGRSKRKVQLLKVKKGVYKPMKAGSPSRETYEQGLEASNVRAEAFQADRKRKKDWIRILKDENSTYQQIQRALYDDEIYVDTWNKVLNADDRAPPNALIMRKRTISIQVENGTAVIPDELQMCELGKPDTDEEDEIDGIKYPKGWPACPISYGPVGPVTTKDGMNRLEFYYAREPASGKVYCYHIDSIDRLRGGQLIFKDIYRNQVVMFERLVDALNKSTLVSSSMKYITMTPREKLFMAARNGNIEPLETAIKEGADVNGTDDTDWTPLHWSARNGHLEVARALIEKGADVNAKEDEGSTPLHYSALNGSLQVVRFLIDKGADVNAKNKVGGQEELTPLHYSADYGHPEVARALIEAGANVNAKTYGETPLHKSAFNGHLEITQALIEAGADVNVKMDDGYKRDWTPLYICARRGHVEVARALIEAGADVNAKTNIDLTPLHLSAARGHLEVVRALIEAGANLNVYDRIGRGRTPLLLSAEGGHLEISKLLIKGGADINVKMYSRNPIDLDSRLLDIVEEIQISDHRSEYFYIGDPRRDRYLNSGRNVRQRVGGGGDTGVDVDLNADSRGAGYGEDDAALAKAIEVLFGKMKNLKMKHEVLAHLKA